MGVGAWYLTTCLTDYMSKAFNESKHSDVSQNKKIYINKEIKIIKVLIMDLKNINEMKTSQESHQEI